MPAEASEQVLWTTVDDAKGRFFDKLRTTDRAQTVLMTVEPGRVAGGPNHHEDSDQVALVLEGEALVRVWEKGPETEPREERCPPGTLLHLPARVQHWVKSVGDEDLVFFSVYAPPEY